MTTNLQQMADHMSVRQGSVRRCLKNVQQKLFALFNNLPWRVANIRRTVDVALVLSDILNHIDVDLQHDEFEQAPTIQLELKGQVSVFIKFSIFVKSSRVNL